MISHGWKESLGPERAGVHDLEAALAVRAVDGPRAQGKTYRYKAKVARSRTTGLVIRDFINRFFDGSTEALMMGLAESPDVSPEMWEKLRSAIKRPAERSDE
jgi:predicted transcriptional regulator